MNYRSSLLICVLACFSVARGMQFSPLKKQSLKVFPTLLKNTNIFKGKNSYCAPSSDTEVSTGFVWSVVGGTVVVAGGFGMLVSNILFNATHPRREYVILKEVKKDEGFTYKNAYEYFDKLNIVDDEGEDGV